jgi:hypothetical protein
MLTGSIRDKKVVGVFVRFSYFTGYTEIYDFRERLKKKEDGKFNLKQFHENSKLR